MFFVNATAQTFSDRLFQLGNALHKSELELQRAPLVLKCVSKDWKNHKSLGRREELSNYRRASKS